MEQTDTISIHALREEGDETAGDKTPAIFISIHALREEGDLANIGEQAILNKISIHALREEGDGALEGVYGREQDFYPRPPRGGRQERMQEAPVWQQISIHALREEGD